ncbi:MAG: class I SAM-dependent methyltransferase [Gammaproteobacteria bacterium]|jgi:tellurite methyltransferase
MSAGPDAPGSGSDDPRQCWNARYAARGEGPLRAAEVLAANLHLLPERGRALDLACGLGANAVLLAQHGLEVDAWDVSDQAIEQLNARVRAGRLNAHPLRRDVTREPPAEQRYDVVVVSYFLERALMPALGAALRPGGLLFYETWSRLQSSGRGPKNPEYRLAEGELLALTLDLQPVFYREEGLLGDTSRGMRDIVQYIGRRPV